MTELEFQTLLQRYLEGRCSPAEAKVVEQFYQELGPPAPAADSPSAQQALLGAMWQRLAARTALDTPLRTSELRVAHRPAATWRARRRSRYRAAALLILTLGVGIWGASFLSPRQPDAAPAAPQAAVAAAAPAWTQHLNATGAEQDITLPDGSRVRLHPGSSLRYPARLAGAQRVVQLSGEAYFKVSKNPARPFLVFTKQVVTTVLGTSFRVRAYEGSPSATVMVSEGRVAVRPRLSARPDATPYPGATDPAAALARPAAGGVLLLPNEQVVCSAGASRLRKELVANPAVLAPQSFVFDDRPVREVLAALEKAYGVAIVSDPDALRACTVTLTLTDPSLYGKLNVLCETLGATYEESEARILFHSKGCKPK